MKTKWLLTVLVLFLMKSTFCQKPTIKLTFTAVDSSTNIKLDSIKIMNRTQGCDRVIYYPNNTLILQYISGIPEISNDADGFQLFPNYPNPVAIQTTISLYVPKTDNVSILVSDAMGHTIIKTNQILSHGFHVFRFTPGEGKLYFFTAQWKQCNRTIKILHPATHSIMAVSLEYIGYEPDASQGKASVDMTDFQFNLGDTLLYIGYAKGLQTGILNVPDTSRNYTFQFACNIPCLGTPVVEYGGQVYNTIQILSQCWLKENLNIGIMINGSEDMTDNGIIEKYCFLNSPDNCTKYGGLYQWNEMMQYAVQQGTQGICPQGWHIPADEEFKILEGTVDSHYGIGDPEWDKSTNDAGYDVGTNLKTTNGWPSGGNGSDLFGFSALPGGFADRPGWTNIGMTGAWWLSTEKETFNDAVYRQLDQSYPTIFRTLFISRKEDGLSVRCIKDN